MSNLTLVQRDAAAAETSLVSEIAFAGPPERRQRSRFARPMYDGIDAVGLAFIVAGLLLIARPAH